MAEPKRLPLLERVVATVSPGWAAARAEDRLRASRAWALEGALRNYDAGSMSRRTKGWNPTSASGSAVVATGLDRLRARSRDLVRNNEWATKGLGVIEDDVVGTGFAVTFEHQDKGLAQAAADRWTAWADSLQVDATGLSDFSGLLGSLMRGMAEGGEMVVRRRWRTAADGLAVPMQLQLLEGDHIDSSREQSVGEAGGRLVQGVEHDPIGRRAAFWLFREHPGDGWSTARDSVRVPASEVLHLFREDRKGQVRGVPWTAPCLLRLRDLAEWEDAVLLRAKLANYFVGTVKLPEPASGFAPADEANQDGALEEWKPGAVQYLNPGEQLEWSEPPEVGVTHSDYLRVGLLAVAAALQVPYEALTGDLRNTSFSSGRMGWLQWQRRIEAYRWRILVPRFCQPAARWFLEALATAENPRFTEVRTTWDPPHREMIDPSTEVRAFKDAIRAGITSRDDVVRSLGRDPAKVRAQAAADHKAQEQAGVMFDSNPAWDLGRKPAGEPGRKPGQASNS